MTNNADNIAAVIGLDDKSGNWIIAINLKVSEIEYVAKNMGSRTGFRTNIIKLSSIELGELASKDNIVCVNCATEYVFHKNVWSAGSRLNRNNILRENSRDDTFFECFNTESARVIINRKGIGYIYKISCTPVENILNDRTFDRNNNIKDRIEFKQRKEIENGMKEINIMRGFNRKIGELMGIEGFNYYKLIESESISITCEFLLKKNYEERKITRAKDDTVTRYNSISHINSIKINILGLTTWELLKQIIDNMTYRRIGLECEIGCITSELIESSQEVSDHLLVMNESKYLKRFVHTDINEENLKIVNLYNVKEDKGEAMFYAIRKDLGMNMNFDSISHRLMADYVLMNQYGFSEKDYWTREVTSMYHLLGTGDVFRYKGKPRDTITRISMALKDMSFEDIEKINVDIPLETVEKYPILTLLGANIAIDDNLGLKRIGELAYKIEQDSHITLKVGGKVSAERLNEYFSIKAEALNELLKRTSNLCMTVERNLEISGALTEDILQTFETKLSDNKHEIYIKGLLLINDDSAYEKIKANLDKWFRIKADAYFSNDLLDGHVKVIGSSRTARERMSELAVGEIDYKQLYEIDSFEAHPIGTINKLLQERKCSKIEIEGSIVLKRIVGIRDYRDKRSTRFVSLGLFRKKCRDFDIETEERICGSKESNKRFGYLMFTADDIRRVRLSAHRNRHLLNIIMETLNRSINKENIRMTNLDNGIQMSIKSSGEKFEDSHKYYYNNFDGKKPQEKRDLRYLIEYAEDTISFSMKFYVD